MKSKGAYEKMVMLTLVIRRLLRKTAYDEII